MTTMTAGFGRIDKWLAAQSTMATTAAAAPPKMVNHHAKLAHNVVKMGGQSQQWIANQHKRKHKLCSNNSNNKRKKGNQLTLLGGIAFEAKRDCVVCKAQFLRTIIEGHRAPNRAHNALCIKKTETAHCAKSCRPFELFANENCKLQNEAKMNVMFERGSARDPRRSPLSAELNDAST